MNCQEREIFIKQANMSIKGGGEVRKHLGIGQACQLQHYNTWDGHNTPFPFLILHFPIFPFVLPLPLPLLSLFLCLLLISNVQSSTSAHSMKASHFEPLNPHSPYSTSYHAGLRL